MSQVRSLLSGTLLCSAAGLLAAAAGLASWKMLPGEMPDTGHWLAEGVILLSLGMGSGLVSGAMVAGLRQLFSRGELVLLGVLASVAVASVVVMLGGFSSGSRLPIVIYAVAVANGALSLPLTGGSRRWFGAH